MIIAKINLKKLLKEHYFTAESGAVYADIILMENRDGPDKYGNDFMVVQGVSKEEREAGTKGPIIGNAKTFGKKQESRPKHQRQSEGSYRRNDRSDDEIDF